MTTVYARKLARIQPFADVSVAEAEGCWYTDETGGKHLDLLSGCWCSVLGHNHPEFVRRLREQTGRLIHLGTGYLSREVAEGAEALLSTLDPAAGEYKVAFVSTGSEAVDLAVKFAKAATGRPGVVSFERGYYGASTSTYHWGGLPKKAFMGTDPGSYHLLAPDCVACPVGREHPGCEYACLEASELRLAATVSGWGGGATGRGGGAGVAAVLFEPVFSAGGVFWPPPGYLERLEATARRWGALLIANEVTTGAGRTGRWHAYQHSSITPDVVVVGKGIGNGLPVAAAVVKSEVEEAAYRVGLVHVQSHQSDPLSGFAVAEVVRLVRGLGLLERNVGLGEELKAKLERVARETGAIRDVRGQGLMAAFAPVSDGPRFHAELTRRGVVTCYRPAYGTVQLMPAYTITSAEIDWFVSVLTSVAASAATWR